MYLCVVGIDKKVEKIYTSARKQMLISSLPPVITLHLKRFHQVGSQTPTFDCPLFISSPAIFDPVVCVTEYGLCCGLNLNINVPPFCFLF